MTREEAMALLNKGRFREWNSYRESHPGWKPDLSGADLSKVKLVFGALSQFNMKEANLCGANLPTLKNIIYDYEPYDKTLANFQRYDESKNEFVPFRRVYLDLVGATIDLFTEFPADFHPTEQGATFVSISSTDSVEALGVRSVFISYAWANEDVVLAIDQWLRLKGIKTKIDKRDFFAGSRIRDEIVRVMGGCEAVIIFYSRESRDKPWAEFERELAGDLEMEAKKEGRTPPRIIYLVIDETQLPSVTERNRIAVMAKGKKFQAVCEELYYSILQVAKKARHIDLEKWSDFVF